MLSKFSLGVVLPKQALSLLGIKKGDPVEVELIERGFVIRVKKGNRQSGGTVSDDRPGEEAEDS